MIMSSDAKEKHQTNKIQQPLMIKTLNKLERMEVPTDKEHLMKAPTEKLGWEGWRWALRPEMDRHSAW